MGVIVEDQSSKRKKAQAKRQQSIHLAQSIMAKERDLELMKPELLTDWYKKDTNVIPAVYRLQRIRYESQLTILPQCD